jgi:hypothetical protein
MPGEDLSDAYRAIERMLRAERERRAMGRILAGGGFPAALYLAAFR